MLNDIQKIDSKVQDLYNKVALARMSYQSPENRQYIAELAQEIDRLLEQKMNMQRLYIVRSNINIR